MELAPMARRFALKFCCANGHTGRYARGPVLDEMIVPMVMAAIAYCDTRRDWAGVGGSRYAAAADKLRDFATVELLCSDMGITRKELGND